jgi:hypothetical protein
MAKSTDKKSSSHFDTIRIEDVPKGRKGKHHTFVAQIVQDLERLPAGSALKIPFEDFRGIRLANIRAALNRVTKAREIDVNTSTDTDALYVWRPKRP